MEITHKEIKAAVIKSQHTQRNWDLSKDINEEDMDLLVHTVTNCPSKQNVAFYEVVVIKDRALIEAIYEETNGFITGPASTTTNSQVLANVLFAFVPVSNEDLLIAKNEHRNTQLDNIKTGKVSETDIKNLERDRYTAIGIASGYLNLTASILGYSTGCCACFNPQRVQEILGTKNPIELLMGVGWKDETKNRRIHHVTGYVFPTKKKQEITVTTK